MFFMVVLFINLVTFIIIIIIIIIIIRHCVSRRSTDYDSDVINNNITFTLDDDSSTFSLTSAQQTSAWPATYTTQLMLTKTPDWSQQDDYRLTVTATVSHIRVLLLLLCA